MERFIFILFPFIWLTACTRAFATAPLLPPTPLTPTSQRSDSPTQSPTPNLPTPAPTETPTTTPIPSDTPYPAETPTPGVPTLITLLFTGQMKNPCDLATPALFSELAEYLQPADFVIGALTTSPSECPADLAETLMEAGFDGVSLCTGETCTALGEALNQTGVRVMNGVQPVVVEVQGVRFGFVTLGGDKLTEENLRAGIAFAREAADVVVVLPAWGADSDPFPDPDQLALAQGAVSAGADLIVGENAQIQAFGETAGMPVFYGLGTLFEMEGAEGLMVRVYFRGAEYLGYEIFPTFAENGAVHLADEAETTKILDDLQAVNERLP